MAKGTCSSKRLPILTEQDVLQHLQAILAHGYGQLEVDVEHGFIRVIRPKPVILGRRPDDLPQ